MSKQKKVDFTLVNSLLDEAEKTLEDDTRVTADVDGDLGSLLDTMLKSEAFGMGAAGAGVIAGGIAGVGLLSALGTVTGLSAAGITSGLAAAGGLIGGGMVVGIGVLAAPALVLGGGAFYAASKIRQKKLIQEKEILIQRIIVAHDHLLKKLELQNTENSERVAHLKLMIDILLGVKKDIEESIPHKGSAKANAELYNRERKGFESSNNIEEDLDEIGPQAELSQNVAKGFSKVKGTAFSLEEQIQTMEGTPMSDFATKEKTKVETKKEKKLFGMEVDVLKHQRERLSDRSDETENQTQQIDEVEKKIDRIKSDAKTWGATLPLPNDIAFVKVKKKDVSPRNEFKSLVDEAHKEGYSEVDIYDVASFEEVKEANDLLKFHYKEYTKQYDLDAVDYTIGGVVGTLAALIDFVFVTNVSGSTVIPGKLKSGVEDLWGKLLSNETIDSQEENFKVSYDISLNTSKISQEVLGLCPLYHRMMSLGHDPILGLVFGVKDLMKGNLTAIDGAGRMIVQEVAGQDKKNIFEAIIYLFGHFLSDVATQSAGGKILSVPAPLTPLLQLVQVGSVEYKGKELTVAELSKQMFYDGYNFNHFVGMSVPVFITEVLTRISFFVKEKLYLKKDIPIKANPKLQAMLFLGNSILFSENIGKLVVTKNPMAINYVSWIATAKYGYRTLKWLAYGREIGKMDNAQKYMDALWEELAQSVEKNTQYLIE